MLKINTENTKESLLLTLQVLRSVYNNFIVNADYCIYFFSGQDTKPGSQLQLTLLWNRPDLASNFILSKFSNWKVRELKPYMHNS